MWVNKDNYKDKEKEKCKEGKNKIQATDLIKMEKKSIAEKSFGQTSQGKIRQRHGKTRRTTTKTKTRKSARKAKTIYRQQI